jgi:YHS domain-containing protein
MNLTGIIVIFAVAALAAFALRRSGGVSCCSGRHENDPAGPDSPDSGDTERDPVCGMQVHVVPETPVAEHQGQVYHFCSHECRRRFLADPAAFAVAPGTPTCPAGRCSHGCCG